MSRPLQIPHPTTTLHLYRHLLREASYLPSVVRPHIDRQIKTRFDVNREIYDPSTHIRQAHHDLRYLRAANAGDLSRMSRVLCWATGRIGRRRRHLIDKLVLPERARPPKIGGSEDLQQYIDAAVAKKAAKAKTQELDRDFLDRWDLDKIRALARSQIQAGIKNSPRADLAKAMNPEGGIPKLDVWGEPLSERRVRTKRKINWKTLVDRLLPPLPRDEWEMLGSIARGKTHVTVPPRRRLARSASGEQDSGRPWNWQAYATRSVASVDEQMNRRNKLLSGLVDEHSPQEAPPVNCHHYTPRLWQRLFMKVWEMTAVMDAKVGGPGWDIVWGGARFQVPAATTAHAELFEGTREDEKVLGSRKKRKN